MCIRDSVSINANDTYQTPNEIQKDFTSLQTDIDNSQGVFEPVSYTHLKSVLF